MVFDSTIGGYALPCVTSLALAILTRNILIERPAVSRLAKRIAVTDAYACNVIALLTLPILFLVLRWFFYSAPLSTNVKVAAVGAVIVLLVAVAEYDQLRKVGTFSTYALLSRLAAFAISAALAVVISVVMFLFL